jgi:hypothetical protein
MTGEGFFIGFASVVDAVRCAGEPRLVMEAPDCLVAGDAAVLRWSSPLLQVHPTQANSIVGLTLYAVRAGKVVETRQAGFPPGSGW